MTRNDLTLVLEWRNHPDIRRNMFAQHEIGFEEHLRWFESGMANPCRYLMIYEDEGVPQGFVSLEHDPHQLVADWGFYATPTAPKGVGRAMGRLALDHAFGLLALHKVCGRVIASNRPSMNLHLALGFRKEGVLRDQYFNGLGHHAVVCFGLLEQEWPLPSKT